MIGSKTIRTARTPRLGLSRAYRAGLNPALAGAPRGRIATALRAEGWATVAGLATVSDVAAEACRLECGHAWIDDRIALVGQ